MPATATRSRETWHTTTEPSPASPGRDHGDGAGLSHDHAGQLVFGSSGNKITNNDSSDNNGFGIRMGFLAGTGAASGNDIVNNTARGKTLADLSQVVPSENSWNDNNRCNTVDGTVPPSVCNMGE